MKGRVRTELEFSIRFVIEPGIDPTPEELQTLDRCLALVQLIKQNALLQGTVKTEQVAPGGSMLEALKQRALALADTTSATEAAASSGAWPCRWSRRASRP